MKKPFTLARVALYSYATVSLMLLCLSVMVRSIFGLLIFGTLTISLIYVADSLSKDKRWARVCSYIIFVVIAIVTVPVLMVFLEDRDKILVEFIWPEMWTLVMLCLGLYSLLKQKPIEDVNTEHEDSNRPR